MKNKQFILVSVCTSLFSLAFSLYFLMSSEGVSLTQWSPHSQPSQQTGAGDAMTDSLEVHFLNVGQGDATLLKSPSGIHTLIDSGPPAGIFKESFSEKMNVFDKNISLLISTHPDADHIGGLKNIFGKYKVGMYLDSFVRSESDLYLEIEKIVDRLERKRTSDKQNYLFAYEGMKLKIYGAVETKNLTNYEIEILAPSFEYVLEKIELCIDKETEKVLKKANSKNKKQKTDSVVEPLTSVQKTTINKKCASGELMDTNEMSVVTLVTYGKNKIMLTGDAPVEVEKYVLQKFADAKSDSKVGILKAGHHGSKTSTDKTFVEALRPEYAIISASLPNRYGHPHKSVVETLLEAHSQVLHTGEVGTISFYLSGKNIGQ